MKLGIVYPRKVIGTDIGQMRAFLQAAEGLEYDNLQIGEHVLGVEPSTRAGWSEKPTPLGTGRGLYDFREIFHEPMVFLTWIAAQTSHIELMTSTLTLPMRQTAIVAKQAAQIDLFSSERLLLGVGVGWNAEEFAALGMGFHDRGRRMDEQIDVLHALWTQDVVEFHGKWHDINGLGINPLPRRSIPIWMGGGPGGPRAIGTSAPVAPGQERVLKRIAQRGDGWLIGGFLDPSRDGLEAIGRLQSYTEEAGRSFDEISLQGSAILAKHPTPDDWGRQAELWRAAGATHFALIPPNAGEANPRYATFDGLLAVMAEFRDVVRS